MGLIQIVSSCWQLPVPLVTYPRRHAKYCDEHVYVSLLAYLKNVETSGNILHVTCGCGSVLI